VLDSRSAPLKSRSKSGFIRGDLGHNPTATGPIPRWVRLKQYPAPHRRPASPRLSVPPAALSASVGPTAVPPLRIVKFVQVPCVRGHQVVHLLENPKPVAAALLLVTRLVTRRAFAAAAARLHRFPGSVVAERRACDPACDPDALFCLRCALLSDWFGWWSRAESNRRPLECHSSALPTELRPRPTRWRSRRAAGER